MEKRTQPLLLTVLVIIVGTLSFEGCSSNDEPGLVDCTASDLSISLVTKTDPTSCTSGNGSITVAASGGRAPYQFKLNTNAYGASTVFNNLLPGVFIVTVKDQNGCERELNVTLDAPAGVTATATTDPNSKCLQPYDGRIAVTASGGSGTYEYSIDGTTFGTSPNFINLRDGLYTVIVRDAGGSGCSFNLSVTVGRVPTGITYNGDILAIFQARCQNAGCHPGNGDLFTYSAAFNRRNDIKARTQSGNMPPGGGGITADEKAKIACWVDDGAPQN